MKREKLLPNLAYSNLRGIFTLSGDLGGADLGEALEPRVGNLNSQMQIGHRIADLADLIGRIARTQVAAQAKG